MAVLALESCGRIGFGVAPDATGDSGGSGSSAERSGTRLKLRWYQFPDGSRVPAGVYDSLRGEACAPATLGGQTYCVPADLGIAQFADSSCTVPVAASTPGCPAPAYTLALDACLQFGTLYATGSALAPTQTYEDILGCMPYGAAGAYSLSAVGPPVDLGTLAALDAVASAGSGRLASQLYSGSDGFAIQAPPYDPVLGEMCAPKTHPAVSQCEPSDATATNARLDAACTQPVGIAVAGCSVPRYGGNFDLCAPTFGAIGAPIPTPTLYVGAGSSCTPTSPLPGYQYYSLGLPIPLVELTRGPDTDALHRIQTVSFHADELHFRDDTVAYDARLGAECVIARAADGALRCVPNGAQITSAFSDATCMTPIRVAQVVPLPGCTPPPTPAFAQAGTSSACEVTQTVYQLGSAYPGTLYQKAGSACVPADTSPAPPTYFLGPEVAPSEMAPATLVTDP